MATMNPRSLCTNEQKFDDAGSKFSEEIHKVIELGAAHAAPDIRIFLDELGVTRVALVSPEESS